MGYRAAVLSRGYKGKAQKCGGVVSDGNTVFMTPDDAGDEPFMLAEQLEGIPVLVGSNRFASGALAIQQYQSNVLILDDGFQHLALERDLNLVLLDHRRPVGNGHLLPRGTLREPISALLMADGFIFTRCDPESVSEKSPSLFLDRKAYKSKPFFFATHYPVVYQAKDDGSMAGDLNFRVEKRGIAFSGIAQNDDFRHSLKTQHYDIVNFFRFPDHHLYTQKELESTWREGRKKGAFFVATTEKDYARIRGRVPTDIPLMVLGIRLQFLKNDGVEFSDWVRNHVEEAMRKT
jgi:tetraacyldisaccharide 4'-kinase